MDLTRLAQRTVHDRRAQERAARPGGHGPSVHEPLTGLRAQGWIGERASRDRDLLHHDRRALPVPRGGRAQDRFEAQKKASAAKKKQKQVEIKEVKFRPTTDDGDYAIKLRNMRRFIEEGDKIKITIRFKGREMAHTELGVQMIQRLEEDLKEEVVIESRPRLEGRQMVMMVAPKKK